MPCVAEAASGPGHTQLTFAAGRYFRVFWTIACSVHSFPRLPVPKFPKNVMVVGSLDRSLDVAKGVVELRAGDGATCAIQWLED